jgi:hypothetical protein
VVSPGVDLPVAARAGQGAPLAAALAPGWEVDLRAVKPLSVPPREGGVSVWAAALAAAALQALASRLLWEPPLRLLRWVRP